MTRGWKGLAQQHTALQGRQQELAPCRVGCACREGQIICLVGEAGIGKSRLAYECRRCSSSTLAHCPSLLRGQAMPYHTLLPLLRVMHGVQETDLSPQQRE